MNGFLARRWILALAVACGGCGHGEYEDRLKQSERGAGEDSWVKLLQPPAAIGSTPVMLQLHPNLSTVLPADADPLRRLPAKAEPSGLQATYEVETTDADGGSLYYYCYLCAVETATLGNNSSTEHLRRTWQSRLPAGSVEWNSVNWENVQVSGADGSLRTWKKISFDVAQDFFYRTAQGQEEYRQMDGRIEFYAIDFEGYSVMIGWRIPKTLVDFDEFDMLKDWAKRIAGTLTVK